MKRKKAYGLTAVILIALLCLSTAGCARNPKEQTQAAGGTEEPARTQEQQTQESAQQSENGGEEIGYPLTTGDSLSIWCMNQLNPASVYADYTESPFHMKLAENTGVDVEWMYPAKGADAVQAYHLLLTEEELPDMIFTSIGSDEADLLIDDGLIYDLTEYIPRYAPDYWNYISAPGNEELLRSVKTDKERLFNFATFLQEDYNRTYVGPAIRKDWLEECGLDEPVTLDDWETVLTAFKEKYNATFGFFTARLDNIGIGSGTGAYGTFKGSMYVDDMGKVQYAQVQPEWKEYMEVLHRWYDMGLIDKDSVTMDDAAVRTKVLNNEIGISFTALSQITNWMMDAQAEGTGAQWGGIEYPRTAPGEPTCMIQTQNSYMGWGAMVTTSCPEDKLITALKWLNYGYSEEGLVYWNYGTEGETFILDDNGIPQWTDLILNDADGLGLACAKYTGTNGTGISIQQSQQVRLRNSQESVDAVYKWIENTNAQQHFMPPVGLTEEESVRYTDKMTAINTRVQEMGLKFMTGDESLAQFDAFVEELNGMGLEECLDIMQAAYDRYMSK